MVRSLRLLAPASGAFAAAALALGAMIAAPGAVQAAPVNVEDMARYCVGEASGAFGVSPDQILTLPAEGRSGGAYSVHGQYPQDGSNTTRFECRFGPKRNFTWVRTREQMKDNREAVSAEGEPSSAQVRACNAVEDRIGEVVDTAALKPGAYEIILRYDDGEYVCNVDSENNVSYFEKLM
ncbi:MAG: hypothetical protein WD969_00305 [Paracoccaceae bacterium]